MLRSSSIFQRCDCPNGHSPTSPSYCPSSDGYRPTSPDLTYKSSSAKKPKMSDESKMLWTNFKLEERAQYLKVTAPDCSFVVGCESGSPPESRKFTGHKWIMSEVSPVFERMFNGDFKESKFSDEIPLTDDPEAFGYFRHFVYYDKISFVVENPAMDTLISLHQIGNKYLVEKLMDKCVHVINNTSYQKHIFAYSDWLSAFEFAILIKNVHLIRHTKEAILQNLRKNGSRLNICTFIYDWDLGTFYEFIQFTSIATHPVVLFHIIELYSKFNGLVKLEEIDNIKTTPGTPVDESKCEGGPKITLEMLVKHVRFYEMTLLEFRNGPLKSKLLNKLEKSVLMAQVSYK